MKAGAFAKRDLARRRFVGEYTKGAKARAAADLKKVRLLLAQLRGVDLRTATYLTAITFPLELQARRGLTNNQDCVLMAGQQKSILDMTVLLLEQIFQTPQPESLGLLRVTASAAQAELPLSRAAAAGRASFNTCGMPMLCT